MIRSNLLVLMVKNQTLHNLLKVLVVILKTTKKVKEKVRVKEKNSLNLWKHQKVVEMDLTQAISTKKGMSWSPKLQSLLMKNPKTL